MSDKMGQKDVCKADSTSYLKAGININRYAHGAKKMQGYIAFSMCILERINSVIESFFMVWEV